MRFIGDKHQLFHILAMNTTVNIEELSEVTCKPADSLLPLAIFFSFVVSLQVQYSVAVVDMLF